MYMYRYIQLHTVVSSMWINEFFISEMFVDTWILILDFSPNMPFVHMVHQILWFDESDEKTMKIGIQRIKINSQYSLCLNKRINIYRVLSLISVKSI